MPKTGPVQFRTHLHFGRVSFKNLKLLALNAETARDLYALVDKNRPNLSPEAPFTSDFDSIPRTHRKITQKAKKRSADILLSEHIARAILPDPDMGGFRESPSTPVGLAVMEKISTKGETSRLSFWFDEGFMEKHRVHKSGNVLNDAVGVMILTGLLSSGLDVLEIVNYRPHPAVDGVFDYYGFERQSIPASEFPPTGCHTYTLTKGLFANISYERFVRLHENFPVLEVDRIKSSQIPVPQQRTHSPVLATA